MRELLMGNEAIAIGALAAGVQVVAGYPGTPSSEVLQTIAARNPGGVYVEWSVNEKAGAEVATGAAYSGARSMVTMKQMGLNVASDPVMCVNYIGIKGGMVIYVADDPGPISSQTEQDTRHFGSYSRIPVFDCISPEQAFQAVQDAFDFSEAHKTPVILRSTTRVCHACADIEVPEITPPAAASGFEKDPKKWVIFPRLSYQNKQRLVRRETELAEELSSYRYNSIEGNGPAGIACGGISCAYVREALDGFAHATGTPWQERFTVLQIATPYPFPAKLAKDFLERVETVTVFEELDPVIEDELIHVLGRAAAEAAGTYDLPETAGGTEATVSGESAASNAGTPAGSTRLSGPAPQILGKRSGTVPAAGELSAQIAAEILQKQTGLACDLLLQEHLSGDGTPDAPATSDDAPPDAPTSAEACRVDAPAPDLPVRPPVLCAGCPHRGSFYAVKQAVKKASKASGKLAVYHGDIGCYTLGNAAPLDMVDTCLCMGGGITMAQGMNHADPNTLNFAFVGDSTFFASGITGTVNAVYNQADMILCILDNSTTAMTGHQPHPGMGVTMMGEHVAPVDIEKVLEGIGVPWIRTVDPLDYNASVETTIEAIGQSGVRAIIFKSPCIALFKPDKVCRVDTDRCVGCLRCVREIGCPALTPADNSAPARPRAVIDPALCTGCGLCSQLCPAGFIETERRS